jgi:spore germination protein
LKRLSTVSLCIALACAGALAQAPALPPTAAPTTAPAPTGTLAPAAAPTAAPTTAPAKLEFSEVWAYLMDGEEKYLEGGQSITDLGYFGAGLGMSGKLVGLPSLKRLPSAYKGRVHLVVAELGNYSLTHFCLDPSFPLREPLVAEIAAAAEPYDGVQIDFEALSSRDYENFYSFLSLLKAALGSKTLSVALQAQIKESSENLSYERVGKIVDRIVVMAYDEHWSSGTPGPVASMAWCRKVSAYAQSKVAAPVLVMGAPFYGRAWADKSLSRAYKHSSLVKLIDEKGIETFRREDGIPYAEYLETVSVKLFFEDYDSTLARLDMYRAASVRNVAFWRLGQEDPRVWGAISAASPEPAPAQVPAAGAPFAEAPAPAAFSLP